MPTPYLSRLKLEKELEKRAKSLREKKSRCENYMKKIEELMNKLERYLDTEAPGAIFEEARKYYDMREYDEALKKFEDVEEKLTKMGRELYSKKKAQIEKILGQMQGEEAREIREELKKADDAIKESPVEGLRMLESIEERIEKIAEAEFEARKLSILEKIGGLQGFEWVRESIEGIKERGFKAIAALEKIEKEAVEKIREEMEALISKADKLIEVATSAHYRFAVDEEEKENALKLFGEGNYEEALASARAYYESTKKNFVGFFNKLLGISRMIVEEGKMMDMDMSAQWKMLEEAEMYLKNEEFEKALESLRKATDEAENIKLQRVMEVIREIRDKFLEAKKRDIDIKPYMKMIENAKNLLKIGRHKRAYDLVREAINMLDRRLNLYEQLENELKNLKGILEDLRKENIILEGVDERIEEIEKLLEEDVERAEKKIDELKGVIKINLRDIASTLYNELSDILTKAESTGLDVPEIRSEMEKIEEMMKDEIYKEAIVTLREVEDEVYDAIYNYLSSQLETVDKYGEEGMLKKRDEIKDMLERGEIKKALSEFAALQKMIYEMEDRKYRTRIEEIEKEIAFLEKEGINVVELRGYLERAKRELERKNIELVESYLSKADALAKKSKSLNAIELYNSVKTLAKGVKKIGVDVDKSEIGNAIKELNGAMDARDYEKVISLARELREKIKSIRERALEAKSVIAEVESAVNEMRKNGMDISPLKEDLDTLQSLLEEGRFDEIMEKTRKLKERMKALELRSRAERIKDNVEKLRDILKECGRLKEYKGIINKFLKSYARESREKIISDGEAVLKALNYELEKILKGRVNTLEKELNKFKSRGFYVISEMEELKNVKEEMLRGDYVSAYERIKALERKLEDMRKREKKLQDINELLREKLNFAASLGIDVEEYEKRISDIYLSRNYREMEEKVNELIKEIGSRLKEKLEGLIADVEKELDAMRKRGEDVTAPESLLTKARSQLAAGNHRKALNYIVSAMGEIENFEMQRVTAFGILRRIEDKIKKMKALLPRDLIKAYQDAKSLFLKGDYQASIERSMEVNEKLWDIERITEKIKERNSQIKELVVKAHRAGMDVKNVLKLFNQAKAEYQKLHYTEAYRIVEECYQEARKLIQELLGKYEEIYKGSLKLIQEAGLEDYFKDALDAIESLFEKEDIEALKVKLSSLNEELKEKIESKVEDMMKSFREMAQLVKEMVGENVLNMEEEESRLNELKEKSLAEFTKYYEELMKKMESALLDGVRKRIEEFNRELGKYEKAGINVNEYYEKSAELLSKLGAENYREIYVSLQDMVKAFNSFAQEYFRSYVNNIVEKVSKYSRDMASEFKERMEKLIKEGRYEELPGVVEAADRFIADYKLNVQDLNRKVREIKELLVRANKIGYDIRGYTEELKNVLGSIKNVKDTIKKVEEIHSRLSEALEKLEPKITLSLELRGKVDTRYQAQIKVKNEGDVDALNVRISVDGELRSEKPVELSSIKKGSEEAVDVFLVPGEGKEVTLEAVYTRFDGKEYSSTQKLKVELKKKGFRVEKNKSKVKCSFCRGTILPGMDIVICENCGAVYHLPCARRAGKCVKCGTLFNFE